MQTFVHQVGSFVEDPHENHRQDPRPKHVLCKPSRPMGQQATYGKQFSQRSPGCVVLSVITRNITCFL